MVSTERYKGLNSIVIKRRMFQKVQFYLFKSIPAQAHVYITGQFLDLLWSFISICVYIWGLAYYLFKI